MSIKPVGSVITLTASACGISVDLVVDAVTIAFTTENFQRLEYSNQRRNQAKDENTGATGLILSAFGNIPVQVISNCGDGFPVLNLLPDDNNIDNIRKRFNITRITIQGAPSLSANVDAVYPISVAHKKLLNKFNRFFEVLGMDVSIQYLDQAKLETFSYITTTGITISGNSLITTDNPTGVYNDILLIDFTENVEYEVIKSDGSKQRIKSWSCNFENRVINTEGQ